MEDVGTGAAGCLFGEFAGQHTGIEELDLGRSSPEIVAQNPALDSSPTVWPASTAALHARSQGQDVTEVFAGEWTRFRLDR
ncbi:hypothetical protein [Nocardia sp. NPDC050175]|uniref:hypothetical protein n=1 Tax=Nocardia sp. NPDC050175 TaxID=3364317 RepID=UPI0037A8E0E7